MANYETRPQRREDKITIGYILSQLGYSQTHLNRSVLRSELAHVVSVDLEGEALSQDRLEDLLNHKIEEVQSETPDHLRITSSLAGKIIAEIVSLARNNINDFESVLIKIHGMRLSKSIGPLDLPERMRTPSGLARLLSVNVITDYDNQGKVQKCEQVEKLISESLERSGIICSTYGPHASVESGTPERVEMHVYIGSRYCGSGVLNLREEVEKMHQGYTLAVPGLFVATHDGQVSVYVSKAS